MQGLGPRSAISMACLVVIALGLGACGGRGSSSRELKPTNVEILGQQIDDNGSLTKDAALQLFALSYGALPGVTPPPGGLGRQADGNLAISGVFAHWSELTEDQRVTIRKALGLADTYNPPLRGVGKSRPAGPPSSKFSPELVKVQAQLESHLGSLGVPIYLESPAKAPESDLMGDALVRDGTFGNGCYARVFQDTNKTSGSAVSTLAHELFHCYQQVWSGRPVPWIEEGTAEWVGATITAELGYPVDRADQGWITTYSHTPTRSLITRTYDAFGWFAYVGESGPLWGKLRAIIAAPYSRAAYDAAIKGTPATFVRDWAPAEVDHPPFGATWTITGTGIPPSIAPWKFGYKPLTNGGTLSLNAPNFGAEFATTSLRADVTFFAASATAQGLERDGGSDNPLSTRSGAYCTKAGGNCVCPPGSLRAGTTFPDLAPGNRIYAFSGGSEPAALSISGYSLADACNRSSCAVGTWVNRVPPQISGFIFTSGGTGLTTRFEPNGKVTLDYGSGVTFTGEKGGIGFTLTVTGSGTAIADLPPGDPLRAPVPFHDVDLSGVTGSGTFDFAGNAIPIDADAIAGLTGAAKGSAGAWQLATCDKNRLTITTTNATWTFDRVA